MVTSNLLDGEQVVSRLTLNLQVDACHVQKQDAIIVIQLCRVVCRYDSRLLPLAESQKLVLGIMSLLLLRHYGGCETSTLVGASVFVENNVYKYTFMLP